MKIKTFILAFISVFLASCEDIESVKQVEQKRYELELPNKRVNITEYTIDGCQYIGCLSGDPRSNYLSHKGNCTNPIHNIK